MGNADIDVPGMPPTKPSLERLEAILRLCESADQRADAKVLSAQREKERAQAALERAKAERDAWIADNPPAPEPELVPDPQIELF